MRFLHVTAIIAALYCSAIPAQGVTTGAFEGAVTAQNDGEPLPGAVVVAVHEPTGTQYSTVTRENGRYGIRDVRVGGPYTLTCTMTGFKTQKKENVFVELDEDRVENFELALDTVEE